jgi:hypothetical protein
MPKNTPSPHRFLAPNPPPKSKPKPQSGLRNVQAPAPAKKAIPKPELRFKKITPAKRFLIAPPRHTNNTGDGDENDVWSGSLQSRRKLKRVESIEEPSQSSPEDAPHPDGLVTSIEDEPTLFDGAPVDDELLFKPVSRTKRRRISPESRPAPSSPIAFHTARFKVRAPRTPAPFPSIAASRAHISTSATPAPTSHRPHFILPALPTSPQRPSRPLPEIFSPSRKQGKHIPGGLASTVTSWIIETASTGSGAGSVAWGREREDGVKRRVRLTGMPKGGDDWHEEEVECYAGGVVFVRGETEQGTFKASRASSVVGGDGETRILLAGQGGARGSGGVRIKTGSVVGIRAPMWDVEVGGENWVVGVDWLVV